MTDKHTLTAEAVDELLDESMELVDRGAELRFKLNRIGQAALFAAETKPSGWWTQTRHLLEGAVEREEPLVSHPPRTQVGCVAVLNDHDATGGHLGEIVHEIMSIECRLDEIEHLLPDVHPGSLRCRPKPTNTQG